MKGGRGEEGKVQRRQQQQGRAEICAYAENIRDRHVGLFFSLCHAGQLSESFAFFFLCFR